MPHGEAKRQSSYTFFLFRIIVHGNVNGCEKVNELTNCLLSNKSLLCWTIIENQWLILKSTLFSYPILVQIVSSHEQFTKDGRHH